MVRAHSGDHSKSYSPRSLHRYALGKVAGLIHIAAAQHSHIVSEQLQRHDELQRHQNVVILVQADNLGGNASGTSASLVVNSSTRAPRLRVSLALEMVFS